jgi:hypothetical protein
MVADDGQEQRTSILDYPRRGFTQTHTYFDNDTIIDQTAMMMVRFGTRFVTPLYPYCTPITQDIAPGDETIYFDPQLTEMREGGYLFVIDGDGVDYQLVKVVTMNSDGAFLDQPILDAFGANTVVMPGAYGFSANNANFQRGRMNNYATVDLSITEEAAPIPFIRDSNTQTLTTFDSYPLLDKMPLGDQFDQAYDTGISVYDYDSGNYATRNTWSHAQNVLTREFKFNRVLTPELFDWWKVFGDYTKGSCNPFLMSTRRPDFNIVVKPAAGGTTMTIEGWEWGTTYFGHGAFSRIAITTAAGVHYAVVGAAARDGDDTILSFAPAFPSDDPNWQVDQQISLLMLCRLSDDRVELVHDDLETTVRLNIRTTDA